MNMIRQKYSQELKEFMTEKADEFTRDYAVEAMNIEKLNPGGPISLNVLDFGLNKPLTFEVKFPLQPEVNLTLYKGLCATVNEVEVTERDIDAEIEALRHKHAMMRSIDTPAPAGAVLTLKKQEIDPSGLPLIGRHIEEIRFQFGFDQLGIGTDEQLLNIKAGEKRIISTHDSSAIQRVPQQSTIITSGEAATDENKRSDEVFLSVEAISVEVPELPDIDEDFMKKIDKNLKKIEDLRKWIQINLLSIVAYNYKRQLHSNLITRLIEENPFPISSSIIDYFAKESDDTKSKDDSDQKDEKEVQQEIEREYRWVLMRDEIAKRESIVLADSEIELELELIAKQTGKSIKNIRKLYDDKDRKDHLQNRMLDRKVMDFIIEHAVLDKRKMNLDEFAEVTQLAAASS